MKRVRFDRLAKQSYRQMMRIFQRFGMIFDSLFSDNRFLVLFSFLLAIGLFLTVNFSWLFGNVANQGEVIANVPVIQIYNTENYVVEGMPAFANLTLFGDATDIEVVKSLKQYQIELDLLGLSPGEHVVELRVKNIESGVTTSIDPQKVQVNITPKVTKQANASFELVNEAKLNQEYAVRDIKLSQDTVTIKGSQANIDRVAIVQALIDVANLELGNLNTKAQLVAFDDRGNKLDVVMDPRSVDVTGKVVEYSRILPIEPVFSGVLPEKQAVKSYRFNKNTVLVYGPRNVLNTLTSIRIPVNYANLPAGKEVDVDVPLPAGVKQVEPQSLQVNVEYGPEVTKTLEDIPITTQNLDANYQIKVTNQAQTGVDVSVKGTKELLETLNPEQLKVTADLQGLSPGTHEVPLKIEGPTFFSYQIEAETFTIVIEEK